jgi:hypothetical protein
MSKYDRMGRNFMRAKSQGKHNPNGDIVSCLGCGKDTTHYDCICDECNGDAFEHAPEKENKILRVNGESK